MIEFRREEDGLRAYGENEKDYRIIRSLIWSNKKAAYRRKQNRYRLREIMSNPYSCYRKNIVRIIQGKSPIPFNGYSSPIFSTSQAEVDELFESKNPLFVMSVRRDADFFDMVDTDLIIEDGEVQNKEVERFLLDLVTSVMKDEIEELKELLDVHHLGFIVFDGKYNAEKIRGKYTGDLGIELSVLVPFTEKFTGHVSYPKNPHAKKSDFIDLGMELGRHYNQESIVVINTEGDFGIQYLDGSGKFEKLSDKYKEVKEHDIEVAMSRIHGDPDNNIWFSYPLEGEVQSSFGLVGRFSDREMSEIFSNLYTDRELKRICG